MLYLFLEEINNNTDLHLMSGKSTSVVKVNNNCYKHYTSLVITTT